MKINATSLGQAYAKQKDELDIKVNKTFMVPVSKIVTEKGFNVRELDGEHVEAIKIAYEEGKMLPAIVVKTTSEGFKVVDGHHRIEAAKLAGVSRLECKEFIGTEVDQISFMVTSSQGRNLKPVERAIAYQRLINHGLTKDEIAKSVGRSRADIDNHLVLLQAGDEVMEAVKNGEVSATVVVSEMRKNGSDANDTIMKAVKSARQSGTGKAKVNSFSRKDYTEAMEILVTVEPDYLPQRLKELVEKYIKQ